MKSRRVSLGVKMYAFFIAVIMIVSGVLLVMSVRAFRDAVIVPLSEKLKAAEPLDKELRDYMEYFLTYLGTDELREIQRNTKPDKDTLIDWLEKQPSQEEKRADGSQNTSMLVDAASSYFTLNRFRGHLKADYAWIEIVKDGLVYRILKDIENEETYQSLMDFGTEGGYFTKPAEEYYSPASYVDGKTGMMLRCIPFSLNGGECRVWVAHDVTGPYAAYKSFLIRSILIVLMLTAVVSVISILQIRRFLIRPMRGLAKAATGFTPEEDGTYSEAKVSKVDVNTQDEIGDLSREIRNMQEQIVENTGNLARMTAERERISTEIDLARTIQAAALPQTFPPFPERTEIDLYASMTPAKAVGGDFFDFFFIDDDLLALVIADVSGKGIPAALFMMVAMALIRTQLMNSDNDPAEALEKVNRQLCERNDSMQFVTVWLAVIELSTGKGVACNAGHEKPAFRRTREAFEMLEYKHNMAVGAYKGARYQTREFEMRPGDYLFVYTDGVPEANNVSEEQFGEKRILEALNRDADAGPEELIRRVHEAVDTFAEGMDQFDDITMLCLKYNGGKNQG